MHLDIYRIPVRVASDPTKNIFFKREGGSVLYTGTLTPVYI